MKAVANPESSSWAPLRAFIPRRRSAPPPNLHLQLAATGAGLRAKYGPVIGWEQLIRLLEDRTFVRYPCRLRFDSEPLLPGEFTHALANGNRPEEGYTIFVHPYYEQDLDRVSYLVLSQLAFVNHGSAISADDAETFGSHALGLSKESYFMALCDLSDAIGGDELC